MTDSGRSLSDGDYELKQYLLQSRLNNKNLCIAAVAGFGAMALVWLGAWLVAPEVIESGDEVLFTIFSLTVMAFTFLVVMWIFERVREIAEAVHCSYRK